MPTSYPNSIDSLSNPTSTTVLNDPALRHSTQHINTNDAIVAIQTKLGANLSNVQNSIDYIANLFLLVATEHQSGGFREVVGFPFPDTVSWYVNSTKTIKLVEKEFVYTTPRLLPQQIILKLYDGSISNNVVRTITDVISYNGVFELSRIRTVT